MTIPQRTGLDPGTVDDLVLGHCNPNSDAPAIGRVVALDAGLPVETPGLQVDRRCGSGLQSVLYAAMQVQTGSSDLVIAGGTESMSNAAFYSTEIRWGIRGGGAMLTDGLARARVTAGGQSYPVAGGMLETAENLRRDYSIGREEQDQLALTSHQRAVAAQESGIFAEEIVPVAVEGKRGEVLVDMDEHPRADATLETLAALRPVLGKQDPDSTVTAGNASGQNDGAAVCIVTHPDRAEELGLHPIARLLSWGLAGVAPKTMGFIGDSEPTIRAKAPSKYRLPSSSKRFTSRSTATNPSVNHMGRMPATTRCSVGRDKRIVNQRG